MNPADHLPLLGYSLHRAPVLVPGTSLIRRGVYVYRCPVCKKLFRYDDPYEPICTGPSENRDDHPPEVMKLLRVEPRKVSL